jgi:WD40 repeat protein
MTAARSCAIAAVVAVACFAGGEAKVQGQKPAAPLALNGGDQLMYIGTYAGTIQVFDEATETKVGDIKLQTGIPRALTLSQSRTKFYLMDSTNEKIEIVDIPTRTTVSTFTLSEGNKKVRIRGFQVDPLERFLILLTRSATKQIDRYEIGDITMQFYDLAQKKITRTIPWPRGEEREFVNIRFSPDGKLLYFFGDDVLILETTNFTEVDTWPLSRPIEPGLGRVNFGSVDDFNDDPGFFTGLFTTQDTIQNRRILNLGRVNLVAKTIDLTPIGPAEGISFAMASDRKKAWGLMQQIGRYEVWAFDVAQKKLISRTAFDGRPRMALRVSSNGKLLYVYQAGATIDVFDATTYKKLRTIEMNADQTTTLYILPRK